MTELVLVYLLSTCDLLEAACLTKAEGTTAEGSIEMRNIVRAAFLGGDPWYPTGRNNSSLQRPPVTELEALKVVGPELALDVTGPTDTKQVSKTSNPADESVRRSHGFDKGLQDTQNCSDRTREAAATTEQEKKR